VRSLRSPHIDNRRHAGLRTAGTNAARNRANTNGSNQRATGLLAAQTVRELLEPRRLQQHELPVRLRDGGVFDEGQPPVDQALLDLFDDLRDVEDDLTVLEGQRSAALSLEEPLECLPGPGAQSGPDVGEGLGREELLYLTLHGTIDCRRQGSGQPLQPRCVGDHLGEHGIEGPSMSTCCWTASVTLFARAAWTSGESAKGPRVST
jgi:hypothetical protein